MNLTKKKHLFKRLLLTSISSLGLIGSALGHTLGTGVTRAGAEESVALIQKMELTLTNVAITITDTGGANGGHGSHKLLDFDLGGLCILAATCDLDYVAAAGISATGSVVSGIGSAAAGVDNATLTGTEQNVIPSTAVALTGSAGSFQAMSTAAAWLDGHTTAADLYLNTVIADADVSSNSSITVNGTVTVFYIALGDFA